MIPKGILVSSAALILVVLANLPAISQERNSDELVKLFSTQQTSVGKTRSLIKPQKHRGLALVADGGQVTEVDFSPVEPAQQVNIQIAFDLDSAALRPDQVTKLAPLCEAMAQMPDTRFRVIGHTDARGDESYNDTLSVHRAAAVEDYLSGDCGIAVSRLEAVGVGERYLADAKNPEAEVNRRVEFQALASGT